MSSAATLQKAIAQSTTEEAELITLHAASQEGTFLHNLLKELGVQITQFKLSVAL